MFKEKNMGIILNAIVMRFLGNYGYSWLLQYIYNLYNRPLKCVTLSSHI